MLVTGAASGFTEKHPQPQAEECNCMNRTQMADVSTNTSVTFAQTQVHPQRSPDLEQTAASGTSWPLLGSART